MLSQWGISSGITAPCPWCQWVFTTTHAHQCTLRGPRGGDLGQRMPWGGRHVGSQELPSSAVCCCREPWAPRLCVSGSNWSN